MGNKFVSISSDLDEHQAAQEFDWICDKYATLLNYREMHRKAKSKLDKAKYMIKIDALNFEIRTGLTEFIREESSDD